MSVEARHPGVCEECDGPIRPGQLIDRVQVSEGWMHEVCPPQKPQPVCPTCWVLVPVSGVCGSCGEAVSS